MAEIVAGVALSHSPLIMTNEENAGEKGQGFLHTAQEMKKWLDDTGVEIVVLVSDDHFNSYFYNHMPSFTIGIGECEGWGDWRLPKYKIPVQQELAKHILHTGLENNIDFSYTLSMKVDHGHTQVIHFLNPELNIPVVPIAVNTVAGPLPTMDRCFQVGEILRQSIESWETDKKVAIVASGGLSHWVPIPKIDSKRAEDQALIEILKNGRQEIEQLDEYLQNREKRVTRITSGAVNEEWDRQFLQLMKTKDYQTLRSWDSKFIEENGGNGGQEIRNWLVLMGALQSYDDNVAFYEPIPEWVTGMAIAQFKQPIHQRYEVSISGKGEIDK